jgi:hypothetical protein
MSKNRKPRKKYQGPKYYPGALPLKFGMTEAMKTDLRLPPHLVLEAFKTGNGNEEGAHTLAACLNVGAVLSRTQNSEAQAVMSLGLDAIQSVMNRGNELHKWVMTGNEIKHIGEAINLTDDMQDMTTRADMCQVLKTVFKEAA